MSESVAGAPPPGRGGKRPVEPGKLFVFRDRLLSSSDERNGEQAFLLIACWPLDEVGLARRTPRRRERRRPEQALANLVSRGRVTSTSSWGARRGRREGPRVRERAAEELAALRQRHERRSSVRRAKGMQ